MGRFFKQSGWAAPFLALFIAISALTAGPLSLVLGSVNESSGESEESARDGEVEAVEFNAPARNPSGRSTCCGPGGRATGAFPEHPSGMSQRRGWIPLRAGDRLYQRHQRRLL
jgi:hypothetical protein